MLCYRELNINEINMDLSSIHVSQDVRGQWKVKLFIAKWDALRFVEML